MTDERTRAGVRRELTYRARKRGHTLGKWREFGRISRADCQCCNCLIAGSDDGEIMLPGVADCATFAAVMAEGTSR